MNRWVLPIIVLVTARDAGAGTESHSGSDYAIQVWQVEHGLPDSSVTSIAQTPDGYLWFGTFNGLVRFNGVRFQIFDTRTPGLESEQILRLCVDRADGMWVSAESGHLARYADGRFTAFHEQDGWPMQPCKGRGIRVNSSGTAYFLTEPDEVLRFDGRRFERMLSVASSRNLQGPVSDSDAGALWIASNRVLGLVRNKQWIEFRSEGGGRLPDVTGAVAPARAGGIWVTCAGRLLHVDETRGIIETIKYPPVKSALVWLLEDSAGRIWAGTWGDGLLQLGRDGSYRRYGVKEGLPIEVVRCIFEDREGNLWVGMNGGGLARLKPKTFFSYDRVTDFPSPHPIPLALAPSRRRHPTHPKKRGACRDRQQLDAGDRTLARVGLVLVREGRPHGARAEPTARPS